MKKISIALVSVLALSLGACKKKEPEAAPPPPVEPAPAPAPAPEPAPAPAPAPEPAPQAPADDKADWIVVEAGHAEPKPTDPVIVKFDKFAVTKADFKDPANLEGGKAELEIDLTSLKTDTAK